MILMHSTIDPLVIDVDAIINLQIKLAKRTHDGVHARSGDAVGLGWFVLVAKILFTFIVNMLLNNRQIKTLPHLFESTPENELGGFFAGDL